MVFSWVLVLYFLEHVLTGCACLIQRGVSVSIPGKLQLRSSRHFAGAGNGADMFS